MTRSVIRRVVSATVLIGATLAPVLSPGTAGAAFPGANGRIAFVSDRDGDYEIYTVTSSGGTLKKLTSNTVNDGMPAFSADGTKIVFRRKEPTTDAEIYTMTSTGGSQTRLTNNAVADIEPSWSPDGTKIAFVRKVDGVTGEIFIMNANGSNPVRLTNNAVADDEPVWSPDGRYIAWTRFVDAAQSAANVMRMTPSGTSVIALTACQAPDWCTSPDWSPNSAQIAYSIWPLSGASVWTMNADGSNKVQFTPNEAATNAYPSWSPDGSWIAYTKFNTATGSLIGDLYKRPLGGGSPVQLTTNSADDWNSDWQRV